MKRRARVFGMVLIGVALASVAGAAGSSGVKGRVTGFEKLSLEAYQEAAKPESKRWTWREPSPFVGTQYRPLAAVPHRDICIAFFGQGNSTPFDRMEMLVTGGRVYPSTIVVSPGTKLLFKSSDPFNHRLYIVGNQSFRPEDLRPSGTREWSAPNGAGRYEFRDELFPSVRTYVVVDPTVSQFMLPNRDATFTSDLPAGEYVVRAYFAGKPVSKPTSITVRDRAITELREPLALSAEESK